MVKKNEENETERFFESLSEFHAFIGIITDEAEVKKLGLKNFESEGEGVYWDAHSATAKYLGEFCEKNPEYHIATEVDQIDHDPKDHAKEYKAKYPKIWKKYLAEEIEEEDLPFRYVSYVTLNYRAWVNRSRFFLCKGSKESASCQEVESF